MKVPACPENIEPRGNLTLPFVSKYSLRRLSLSQPKILATRLTDIFHLDKHEISGSSVTFGIILLLHTFHDQIEGGEREDYRISILFPSKDVYLILVMYDNLTPPPVYRNPKSFPTISIDDYSHPLLFDSVR